VNFHKDLVQLAQIFVGAEDREPTAFDISLQQPDPADPEKPT
jgi:hypothetical protein